ncbi:hypothetical protein V8E55_007396 [Tylopilus felleus]
MSHSRGERESESTPRAQNYSSLIQEKLSARQAKRAAKAAERREKSDALKEEGDVFFRNGNFQDAVIRYQQAIDAHGPSAKPILLANLAAAYLKLSLFPEAHDAADRALRADPTSAKARYRRGMARKHLRMWIAADTDFHTLLTLDPGNKDAEAQLELVKAKLEDPSFWDEPDEDFDSYTDLEAPGLMDEPELGESLSESSDCEHTGNVIPCKFYNRSECKNGRACRYSHAPDEKSERDALGRNVCWYYLIGACKFGERCSYLHSKEYLLQKGWWSTAAGVDKEKKRYNLIQMCNKGIADYNSQTKASGTKQTSNKKQPKGKKKRSHRSRSGVEGKSPALHSYSGWGGYDSNGYDENGMFGFTGSDVEELLCQGVKPWDDDAWDVMGALRGY